MENKSSYMSGFYKTAASVSIDPRLLVIMGIRDNNESLSKLAANDPYIAGFCKVASDHGINPSKLVKQAWFLDGVGDWVADKWHGLKRFGGNVINTTKDLYDNFSGVSRELWNNRDYYTKLQTKNLEDLATVANNSFLNGLTKAPGLFGGLLTGLGGLVSGGIKGLVTPGDSMIERALDWGGQSMDWAREGIDNLGTDNLNLRNLQNYFGRGANRALDNYITRNNLGGDPANYDAFGELAAYGARGAKFGFNQAGELLGFAGVGKLASKAGGKIMHRTGRGGTPPTPPSTPPTPPSTPPTPPSTPPALPGPPSPPSPPAPGMHWWQKPGVRTAGRIVGNGAMVTIGGKEEWNDQSEMLAANRRARELADIVSYSTANNVPYASTYYNSAPYSPQSSIRRSTVQDKERSRSLVNNPNKDIMERYRKNRAIKDSQRFDELYGNH